MKALEILVAAKELISDENRWTQHTYAKTVDGRGALSDDPGAVCWCSLGAISKIVGLYDNPEANRAEDYLNAAAKRMGLVNVITANDKSIHDEVMMMWDSAIEMAHEGTYENA